MSKCKSDANLEGLNAEELQKDVTTKHHLFPKKKKKIMFSFGYCLLMAKQHYYNIFTDQNQLVLFHMALCFWTLLIIFIDALILNIPLAATKLCPPSFLLSSLEAYQIQARKFERHVVHILWP